MTDTDKLIELLLEDMASSPVDDVTTINRDELTQLSAALQAAQKEIERLTGEQWAFEDAVSQAIGSPRFMDPPDGGDVSLPEQVDRMHQALEAAEREREELRKALEPFANELEHEHCMEDNELAMPRLCDLTYGDFRRARAALNQERLG